MIRIKNEQKRSLCDNGSNDTTTANCVEVEKNTKFLENRTPFHLIIMFLLFLLHFFIQFFSFMLIFTHESSIPPFFFSLVFSRIYVPTLFFLVLLLKCDRITCIRAHILMMMMILAEFFNLRFFINICIHIK